MKGDSSTKIYTEEGRKNHNRIFGKKKPKGKEINAKFSRIRAYSQRS